MASFFQVACSTTPTKKSDATRVSAEKQALYRVKNGDRNAFITVVRDRGFIGSACDTDILIDNTRVGQVGPGEYIEIFLSAGTYILGANPRGICVGTLIEEQVNLKSGEVRFRIGIGANGNMRLMRTAL